MTDDELLAGMARRMLQGHTWAIFAKRDPDHPTLECLTNHMYVILDDAEVELVKRLGVVR